MFVYNVGITWVRLWSEVVLPDMLVFDWSRHSCQLPPILWSSWGPMTTIEDDEFFFSRVTLGIMCRLKWVVATLRGLWPCGTFWLMELMLTLWDYWVSRWFSVLLGFLVFKTSPFVFLSLLKYLCFF